MALGTITNKLGTLADVFNRVDRVLFNDSTIATTSALSALTTVHSELPVIDGSITLNMGEADVTKIKITTGQDWASYAQTGESDISMQVASISTVMNDLFGDFATTEIEFDLSTSIVKPVGETASVSFVGKGYGTKPKKIAGSLIFISQDEKALIVLPKAEIFATFVAADGDNPAYWNLVITALANESDVAYYLLNQGELSD